jgi:hypothetical protein
MSWQDLALIAAGVIGSVVAVIHGTLVQRRMIAPLRQHLATDPRLGGALGKLVPLLLQFSTYAWLLGGLALIAAPFWAGREGKLATGILVGAMYLFAAIGNGSATRWRHPGWMLMAIALVLILFGMSGHGG